MEKNNAKSTTELSKSLETTRAHLQGQLRSKEAENNRLTVQIKVCYCETTRLLLSHGLMPNFKETFRPLQYKFRLHVTVDLVEIISFVFLLIQNLERAANQQKAGMERLKEQLATMKQQMISDREALKRATRVQKQQAERSESTAGQLSVQLLEMVRPGFII